MWNFPIAPPKASNFAPEFDALYGLLSLLTGVFTLIVGVVVFIFITKYRRGRKADRTNPVNDHLKIELVWTIIPTLLGLAVFAWGAKLYIEMRTPPKDAYEVFVIGKQWMWHVQHPNGVRENNELHVPIGVPVRLTMISQDVIHGFYIPAFRVQYHVVPGRYTTMWFTATKEGKYNLFCTIHCGTQHSEMGGFVYAMPQNRFSQWLANGGNRFQRPALTMADQGKQLFDKLACSTCHGAQDTLQGPSLAGIFGKTRRFTDGSTTVADESYLRESIISPYNRITQGYDKTMPVYLLRSQVTEENIRQLIEYIKSLGQPASPTVAQQLEQQGRAAATTAPTPANP